MLYSGVPHVTTPIYKPQLIDIINRHSIAITFD